MLSKLDIEITWQEFFKNYYQHALVIKYKFFLKLYLIHVQCKERNRSGKKEQRRNCRTENKIIKIKTCQMISIADCLAQNYNMIQQFLLWVHIQNNWNQEIK